MNDGSLARVQCDNFYKMNFDGVGKYGIPQIDRLEIIPEGELIPVHNAAMQKFKGQEKSIIPHFFCYDFLFEKYWNVPDKYIEKLKKYSAVVAPDFSMYTDMPLAMQIYNHYRKHWLAAYWQLCGITVIPNIGWSDESSYDWCFDGEPEESVVCVSSVGTQVDKQAKKLFLQGYEEMMKRIRPKTVLFYGKVPDGVTGNIVNVAIYRDIVKKGRAHDNG